MFISRWRRGKTSKRCALFNHALARLLAGRRHRLIILLGLLLQQVQVHGADERLVMVVVVVVVRRAEDLGRLDVLLQLLHVALELGPPVLEPGDYLGVRQAECQRYLFVIPKETC